MLRKKQLIYELSVAPVAVTTFNNILLCLCLCVSTEWKVLDFCLFSIEQDVGKKKELDHFMLYASSMETSSSS